MYVCMYMYVCTWVVCCWDKYLRWLKGTFTCTIKANRWMSPWIKRQRNHTMASATIIKQLSNTEGHKVMSQKQKKIMSAMRHICWPHVNWVLYGNYGATIRQWRCRLMGKWQMRDFKMRMYVCICKWHVQMCRRKYIYT